MVYVILVYPDGKVYEGDIKKGEIEGEGRMLIPSLGMHEGAFKSGKYHGYGVYNSWSWGTSDQF